MKKTVQTLFFTLIILTLFNACGTKKNNIISRNYQALTTKYNVLYNGNLALEEGVKSLNDSYKDDWFEILPIEPLDFDDDKFIIPTNTGMGAGFDKNDTKKAETPFEKAELKAVKAIQKHGMNIDGLERNRQIDEAYFLLGKARYYSQRYIPAIEAFNYVIANYPNASLITETKIWKAKANIRNDFENTAIESMNLLLYVKDTLEADQPDHLKELAHTAMAMAYLRSDTIEKAKKHLALATRTLKNKEQGARNLFILGQLFAAEGKKDSANMVFTKLTKFNQAPQKYLIHAEIELAKNTTSDSSANVVLKRLDELIKDRDNRSYLDELYYHKAVLLEQKDSIKLASTYYQKSLKATTSSPKQKTFTHEKLGNLYFNQALFEKASAHYDTVLQIAKDDNSLRIRRIKRKSESLENLIKNEQIVTLNDSILKLSNLSKDEKTAYFTTYVEKLKKADEELAQLLANRANFSNTTGSLQSSNKKQTWYFYNNLALSNGKSEFKRFWGDRILEDNWRWSSKLNNSKNTADNLITNDIGRYDIDAYVASIPTSQVVIDSLKNQKNDALYNLGLIYKEQFKNAHLAIDRLERLENSNPKEELLLPINWHLYQLYKNTNQEKATVYKNFILKNYPESVFAQSIQNPEEIIETTVDENELAKTYKELYYLYKEEKFEEVITKIDAILPTLNENELKPKFYLLKAFAIGKSQSKENYKQALNYVAINFGNTEEATKAQEILSKLKEE